MDRPMGTYSLGMRQRTKIAQAIIRRHQSLAKFLELFDLDEATIYEDVEGMEHHMSPETLAAIIGLTEELQRQPALVKRVQERMKKIKRA